MKLCLSNYGENKAQREVTGLERERERERERGY
jgi:hypothetical protein